MRALVLTNNFALLFLLTWMCSPVCAQQEFYIKNWIDLFDVVNYNNGARVPIKLKEGITLTEGIYHDTTAVPEGGDRYRIVYSPDMDTIIFERFYDFIWLDGSVRKGHEHFTICNGKIRLFQQYHDGLLYEYFSYRNFKEDADQEYGFKIRPGDIDIKYDQDSGLLQMYERVDDTLTYGKVYRYGIRYLEGAIVNRKKHGIWSRYSNDGFLIEEEWWDNGVLIRTVDQRLSK